MLVKIAGLLEHRPEEVCYLVVENEKGEILAFILLQLLQEFEYVHVIQIWADPKLRLNPIIDQLFMQAMRWIRMNGKKEMRGETQRNAGAFTRVWGGETHAVVVKFRLENVQRVMKSRELRRKRSKKNE